MNFQDELYLKFESAVKYFENAIGVPDLNKYNNVFLGGILGSLFSLLQYFSSPFLGALSDYYGRKPLLLVSVIGSFFSYYLWSISDTFWIFVLSRIVGGFSRASVSIAITIVSDICSSENRGRGMAFVGIAFSIGFILGPMIGAYFSMNSRNSVNITMNPSTMVNAPRFAMILTIFELLLIILCLPESLEKNNQKNPGFFSSTMSYVSPKSLFGFSLVKKSLDTPSLSKIRSYGFIYFLYLFLYSGLEFTLSFYTHIRFAYDSMQQGRMYLFIGLLMIFIQGGFVRKIKPEKHHRMAFFGILVLIPAYLFISFAHSQGIFYLGLLLYSIASGIVVPCLTTLISQLSPESEKGATMGIFRSLGALSRAGGPVFGSLRNIMFLENLIDLIHRIPHVNFRFRQVSNNFDYDLSSEYAQSLAIFGIAAGLVGLLFLLIITITWICQCCRNKENNQRSRKSIRNLTLALFTLSVVCFSLLGGCLYGNERINRSVGKTVNGLEDIHRNLKQASNQWDFLSKSQEKATKHVDDLVKLIDQKTRESQSINKTMLDEVDAELTSVSDKVDEIKAALNRINITLGDMKKVEKAKLYTDRFEFDRWTFYVILPSIIIAVLFIGVISFCWRSRKGSITFSALGIVTFIVTWALIAIVVPVTIAHADLCASHEEFIRSHLRPDFYKGYLFYKSCKVTEEHKSVPPEVPIGDMSRIFSEIQAGEARLVNLLNTLFNSSADVTEAVRKITDDVTDSYKKIGAIESSLSCFSLHDDVVDVHKGICHDAVVGSIIMLFSIFFLGFFMFILLIVVSRTWYMFNRLPSDYIEVGEDDPFFTRQQDTIIPAEIYGTHVFNHRTQLTHDPSTGTTSATNVLNQQNSQTTPLLESTWQRGTSVPLASGNNSISAATGNSVLRSTSPYLSNDDPYRFPQRSHYHEQFEV